MIVSEGHPVTPLWTGTNWKMQLTG